MVSPAHAAPASDPNRTGAPAATAAEEIPGYREAEALYDQGKAKFDTADYGGAVELWTEAYRSLPDRVETSDIKTLLMYDIARAREQAFDVSGDVAELRQARILFQRYRESIPQLYPDAGGAEAERTQVDERIAALDRRIEEAEQTAVAAAPSPTDDSPDRARPLIIAGSTVLAVGVAGLGVMAGGLVMGSQANDISDLDPDDTAGRREQFDRGRTGNLLAIVGGSVGGVLAVAGGVLLGIGVTRKSEGRTALAPWFGPEGAGASVRLRF